MKEVLVDSGYVTEAVVTKPENDQAGQPTWPLHLFPGMDGALRALAGADLKLAVVSSNSRANVARIIGPELLPLFLHLDCGASMFGKAAKLRTMVRRAGVSAAETIYLGDEVRDAEAARSAGVDFGAVAWGQHRIEALAAENPALVFHAVEELGAKLRNCGRTAKEFRP